MKMSWRRSTHFPSIGRVSEVVHVTAVQAVAEHRLRLRFEDGVEGELDFSAQLWRGVFAPLADTGYFAGVELDPELGTIVWPNGADIAPETLHRWVSERVETVPA
jgi:hypothetical protein